MISATSVLLPPLTTSNVAMWWNNLLDSLSAATELFSTGVWNGGLANADVAAIERHATPIAMANRFLETFFIGNSWSIVLDCGELRQ